jgi:hypothetical protein
MCVSAVAVFEPSPSDAGSMDYELLSQRLISLRLRTINYELIVKGGIMFCTGILCVIMISITPLKEQLSDFYEKVETIKPWRLDIPTVSISNENPDFSIAGPAHFMNWEMPLSFSKGDTFIGTGDTLLVTGEWSYTGDIYVVDAGVFLAKNATITLNGDIIVLGGGLVDIDSSHVCMVQRHIYERNWIVADSATFRMQNTTTNYSGYPSGLTLHGANPTFIWENVRNADFTTAGVLGGGSVTVHDVDVAGEWVILQNPTLTLSKIDLMLHWYTFGEGAVVDFTFPPSPVYDFTMDSTQPGVSGIDYSVHIDSVETMWWGSMSRAGSDVTFRDSEMRIMGIMFDTDDSVSLSGLVNNQTYSDLTLPLTDRTLRFVNTSLGTWNLYPGFNDSIVVAPYFFLTGSIVGEILGMGRSQVLAERYTLDGSGGHLEANGNAFVVSILSTIMGDVITKESGVAVIGWSAQVLGSGWATDSSKLIYVNTYIPSDPIAFDSAAVWMVNLEGPAQGYVDDTVDITGSAWVDGGPVNPVDMIQYQLLYRERGDSDWIAIDTAYTSEIHRSVLGHWDTEGLSPGPHDLALIVWGTDETIDSLMGENGITLLPGPGVNERETASISERSLSVSPVSTGVSIRYGLPNRENVVITAYSVDGRRVATLVADERSAGRHSLTWHPETSGIYWLRMKASNDSITRKAIWLH